MTMRQVEGDGVPIPAGEVVELKPGGLHLMCIGKETPAELGSRMDIVLEFANAGAVNVTAEVVAPEAHDMSAGPMEQD